MKKRGALVLLSLGLFCNISLHAQGDSLSLQRQILKMEQSLRSIKSENGMLKRSVRVQGERISEQNEILDSLKSAVTINSQNIKVTANQLGVKIDEANAVLQTKAAANDLKTRTLWGVSLFILLATIAFIVYWLLHKRIIKGHLDVAALKQKADKLNEDILNRFSLDMVEMQKIAASLVALTSAQELQVNNVAPDHSLIKTLADRITFMEMTLYQMDKTVKGHKTLTKAITNMKNNLFANGYELVDMLGKQYHEGMLVNNVDFIDDETLEKGEQIITKIIKPQINYKGQMIQSAQIQVSKNF